ncbi:MAG: methyltransferase type 11 [Acidobacteria bacterium]|nr:MAG: methyltransferase type 11 [Acidobacteriota bacterium]
MKNGLAPYDKQATSYDRTWRRYIARTLGFLKATISFRSSDKILDIACGTGEFERLILREHPDQQMIGIDISENMLNFAREKCRAYPNAAFLKADASALPFPDQTFDLVVTANSLHYFDKPSVSLAEMRRVLLPAGSLVILDWCKDYLMCRCFDFCFRRIERGYQSCYTQRELQRLLDAAGFAIQSTRKIKLGSIFWGHMIAVATPKG